MFLEIGYMFFSMLTVLITVIWHPGIMGLAGLEINIMTYIVPTLLFIIGIGDLIHIQARFREIFSNNPSNPKRECSKPCLKCLESYF